MTCSVVTSAAVTGSPVFSPSHAGAVPCKVASSSEILTLTMGSPSPALSRLHSGDPAMKGASFDAPSRSGKGEAPGMKRKKRPPRIDIPAVTGVLGAWGMGREVAEVEGEGYSVCCKRGRKREQMEDRYEAAVEVDGDSRTAFFGVFDGHGGAKVAEYVSKNLKKHVMHELAKVGDGANEVREAIKAGYQSMDAELCKQGVAGGACSVTALTRNGEIMVSNAGDCRAVMSTGGTAEAITSDHRPSRQDERERIENLGGFVGRYHGVWRLQGSLAVSRGFGDAHFKQWVMAEPETTIMKLKSDSEFIILASDGLWEKVSNQEAVDIARPMCVNKSSLLLACRSLVELSVSRGSSDDVSVMIIQLRWFKSSGV